MRRPTIRLILAFSLTCLVVGPVAATHPGDLHGAIIKGDVTRVKDLLAAGHAVNARDKDGYTPLFWAAFGGHADIANLLLAKGADVNAKNSKGITPLSEASYRGHRKVVELLLAAGADINARGEKGQTSLHAAVDRGYPAVVEVLLKANHIDVNARDDRDFRPLDYVMARLWQKYKDETDKQAQDRVRLQVALAKLLLDHKKIDLNTPQKYGGAPMHYVAGAGNLELARVLLAKGAEVNVRDHSPPYRRPLPSENTPLHWAIKAGQSDMAKFLLEHGADPNAKNSQGETPSELGKGKKSG
jgi:ankyrin repeat protein